MRICREQVGNGTYIVINSVDTWPKHTGKESKATKNTVGHQCLQYVLPNCQNTCSSHLDFGLRYHSVDKHTQQYVESEWNVSITMGWFQAARVTKTTGAKCPLSCWLELVVPTIAAGRHSWFYTNFIGSTEASLDSVMPCGKRWWEAAAIQ